MLIKESSDQEKKTKGKKKTPFVKEALPGEDQKYTANRLYLGICRFASIFFVLLHLFVMYDTFSLWGNGNAVMISISAVELGCATYTYMMAKTTDISFLSTLYNLRNLYKAFVFIVTLPVGLTTIMSLYAY